jgi:hypothetical protein
MVIILVLAGLAIFGIFAVLVFDWEDFGVILFIAAAICLLGAIVALPLNHMGVNAQIEAYSSVKETLREARENDNQLEIAAFQMKVAEMNQWRAETQYWNTTAFSLWIPDKVMELKPIK